MMNPPAGSVSTPKIIPFKGLLSRLESSLSAIDSKTKPFQVNEKLMTESKDCPKRSDFESELTTLVELAEEINNNLPF